MEVGSFSQFSTTNMVSVEAFEITMANPSIFILIHWINLLKLASDFSN
jgi:hypothetical protein